MKKELLTFSCEAYITRTWVYAMFIAERLSTYFGSHMWVYRSKLGERSVWVVAFDKRQAEDYK